MKNQLILFCIMLLTFSCKSQESNTELTLNYKAQTRGFTYLIQLENNQLHLTNNSIVKTHKINVLQASKIKEALENIDLNKMESKLNKEDLAVDKAIKGVLYINLNKNEYLFEINHNELPEKFKHLFKQLEELLE